MGGLVAAGPWLTMVGSRVMARRTSRPAMLLAGRRLSDNPRGAFRSVSGLILALFITSVAVGITGTIIADHGAPAGGAVVKNTLIDQVGYLTSDRPVTSVASIPSAVLTKAGSVPGISGVTVIHFGPNANQTAASGVFTGLVSCAQLSRTPALGRCSAGADVATITPNYGNASGFTANSSQTATIWSSSTVPTADLQSLPVQAVAVGTDGSTAAIERARTALEVAFPYQGPPATIGEINTSSARELAEIQHMTDVVIVASLVIAACSLAVSVSAGVSDRKRPFSLLRLTGVPISVLRQVVALEAAVPLIVIAFVAAGTGLLAADLLLKSGLDVSIRPPGVDYYATIVGGLIASLGIITSTLPLIERITGPEVARNE